MSMLTPPGEGRQFRVSGARYPRMRRTYRRRRRALGLIAVVAVLGVIGWGTLQLFDVFSGGKKGGDVAANSSGCTTETTPTAAPKPLPEPGKIKVNVLNATKVSGLAKRTADELKKRGFVIGTVGNATKEYDKKVESTGVLLGPKTATDTTLKVLATQLSGAEQATDDRKGGDVDLIIGKKFKELVKKADAEKALTALTAPKPSRSPANPDGC